MLRLPTEWDTVLEPRKEYKAMCRVTCEVVDGLVPWEQTARIKSIGGMIEEVSVSRKQIIEGAAILASEIGRDGPNVLVELPRESASGRWRLWVGEDQLVK